MARHVRNPKIESRSARQKLKPSAKPTYFDLGGKLHLGYRRGTGAGVWVARRYIGSERYVTRTIGEADDLADANGGSVLDFRQAQIKAREWASDLDEKDHVKSFGPAITINRAIDEYIDQRRTASDARSKLRRLKELGDTPMAELTVSALEKWRAGIVREISEVGTRRIVADAKACLNAAAKRHRDRLPASIPAIIKDGLAHPRGSASENTGEPQILMDADVRRLVDAAWQIDAEGGWGGHLGRMVLVLASTGARLSQVQRLRVADLDVGKQRLMMPVSYKGKGEKKTSYVAVPIGQDVAAALEAVTRGRPGTDILLLRPRWRAVPGVGRFEVERSGWRAASELTVPWKGIVARAGLPSNLVAYALRHSSITRMLKRGLPTALVSRLHDTSPEMLQRNYTRFISDALDDLARSAITPLMPTPPTPLRAVEG